MNQRSSSQHNTDYSVLIAVHGNDDAELFYDALKSLVDQTMPAAEVVLVQDGHIDEHLSSVIDVYKPLLPLKVVVIDECVGLGLALKEGFSHCSLELVGRADSDDVNLTDRFEKQVAYLNENDKVGVVGSNLIEENGEQSRLKLVPAQVTLGFRTFFRNPINHQTVMFRKQVVMEVGGYEDCPSFEDYLLWCKLLSNGVTISNLEEALVRASISDLIKKRSGHAYAERERDFYRRLKAMLPQYKFTILLAACVRIWLRYIPAFLVERLYNRLRAPLKI